MVNIGLVKLRDIAPLSCGFASFLLKEILYRHLHIIIPPFKESPIFRNYFFLFLSLQVKSFPCFPLQQLDIDSLSTLAPPYVWCLQCLHYYSFVIRKRRPQIFCNCFVGDQECGKRDSANTQGQLSYIVCDVELLRVVPKSFAPNPFTNALKTFLTLDSLVLLLSDNTQFKSPARMQCCGIDFLPLPTCILKSSPNHGTQSLWRGPCVSVVRYFILLMSK
jgi:hypothetical protein